MYRPGAFPAGFLVLLPGHQLWRRTVAHDLYHDAEPGRFQSADGPGVRYDHLRPELCGCATASRLSGERHFVRAFWREGGGTGGSPLSAGKALSDPRVVYRGAAE